MIRAGLVGLCVLTCAFASHAAAPIALVTGNGRITVALDETGGLAQFSWPGPGAAPLLGDAGARWHMATPEGPVDFSDEDWTIAQQYAAPDSLVVVTQYTENGGARSAEQTVAAIPDQDLLLVRLRLKGFASTTRVFWSQSFLPYGHLVPGLAGEQPSIRAMNGFAAGYDSEARLLEHGRPIAPGKTQWRQGRDWVRGGTYAETGPGLYVGAAFINDIVQGTVCGDWEVWTRWAAPAPLPGTARIVGSAIGIVELTPVVSDSALELVLLLGASDSRAGLRRTLAVGIPKGATELEAVASRPGGAWGAVSPENGGEGPLLQRWCLNLLLSIDPTSGAALHAPLLADSAVYSDVFDTAWSAAALDGMGLPDAAQRALAHHIQSVRSAQGVDTPAGSLPRKVYRDGATASFSGNADPESAAWLLAACWHHAASLAVPERRGFLEPHWPALSRCADYLAREPRVGSALSGALTADAAPLDTLRTHYLGLESSRRMAEALGEVEPGLWTDRRDEIYARLRFRKLNQSGGGESGTPWVDWWITQMPGAKAETGTGWEVLKSEGAPVLTEEAIVEWVREAGLGPGAPLALRDALRCLLAGYGN